MTRNQGFAEDFPPKKYIPRRRVQDKDLTCFKLEFPADLEFETASCSLYPSLPLVYQKPFAVIPSNESVCLDANAAV